MKPFNRKKSQLDIKIEFFFLKKKNHKRNAKESTILYNTVQV